jgi:hypothetical protein
MGRPAFLQGSVLLSLRVPAMLRAALHAKARVSGLNRSELLRRIIEAYCRGEACVTVVKPAIVVRRTRGHGRLAGATSRAAQEWALLELADEAHGLAQALLAAEQPATAAAYYRTVAQLLRLWMRAHRDRDLDALRQRLAQLEAQQRGLEERAA